MEPALKRLMKRFPPPANPRSTPVNWTNIEQALDWTYPQHFKDYVDVYGGCVWFDDVRPIYMQGLTQENAGELPAFIESRCDIDRGNTYDADGKPFSPPFYPEDGGLMPWLLDYSGNMYYWDTGASEDPEAWPVIQSHGGWMTPFPAMSLPTMILKWLEQDAVMTEIWGKLERWPEEQRRITES